MDKIFIEEIRKLRVFNEGMIAYDTWKAKRLYKKQYKKVMKLVHKAAVKQSHIAYEQTYNLYKDIVSSNIE